MRPLLFTCLLISGWLCAQPYTGPIPVPSFGYGAPGTELVDSVTFTNPTDPTDTSYVYYPVGTSAPVPTVFFMAGNGGDSPVFYRPYFHFIVSKGFAVVFVPAPTSQATLTRYANMEGGFKYAARTYPQFIDTTRVGFAGHSFGGGACFGISNNLFTDHNWGSNGRFLMPTAQWYSHGITQAELQNFPANTYLLSFIFYNDVVCDHRMAIEIFNNISIPPADKDIVMVTSSMTQAYSYNADHVLPNTSARYDAMDYYVLYRLTDAMMDFVFNQNIAAKNTCLGDGSAAQSDMPTGLSPLLVSDTLSVWHPEGQYGYPCSSQANPRWMYCDLPTDIPSGPAVDMTIAAASGELILQNGTIGSVFELTDATGRILQRGIITSPEERLERGSLVPGIYFVRSGNTVLRFLQN